MFNVERVREDFPPLKTGVIYLDNAASSLTPKVVIDKMLEYYTEYRANIERGLYYFSQKASEEYEEARKEVASLIAASPEEIIFVKNTTEGINMTAHGLKFKRGDRVVTTLLEHHSNLLPWMRCRDRYGIELVMVKPSREGFLDPADFERLVNDNTRLVAVTHVSNVLGTISPVREIAAIAHEHGALMLVDGAQSVPHMKIDVKKLDCDILAFSGHKMCGPTGSGVLYLRGEASKEVEPPYVGGGTVEYVNTEGFRLHKGPERFEAGTPAIGDVLGLKAAVQYLKALGMEAVESHERILAKKVYKGLSEMENVEVYGPEPDRKLGVTSFNVKGLSPHDVALALDCLAKIAVRSGMHCAQPLVRHVLGKPQGTVRLSPYLYNTQEEIDKFLEILGEIARSATT